MHKKYFTDKEKLVGAAAGGASYAIQAGSSFTWGGFGQAVGVGAIGGAISGGIGGLGGGLANNIGLQLLGSVASYGATSAITGQPLTLNGFLGGIAGGFVSGLIPGYQGGGGNWLMEIAGEVAHDAAVGAVAGGVSGGVTSALNGGDIGAGVLNGAARGAISGAVGAAVQIAAFGHAIQPSDPGTKASLQQMRKNYGVGDYGPIFRSGGGVGALLNAFGTPGIVLGRNALVTGRDQLPLTWATRGLTAADWSDYLFLHEGAHYYGQLTHYGFGEFYRQGINEQVGRIFGVDPYRIQGFQEWNATYRIARKYTGRGW